MEGMKKKLLTTVLAGSLVGSPIASAGDACDDPRVVIDKDYTNEISGVVQDTHLIHKTHSMYDYLGLGHSERGYTEPDPDVHYGTYPGLDLWVKLYNSEEDKTYCADFSSTRYDKHTGDSGVWVIEKLEEILSKAGNRQVTIGDPEKNYEVMSIEGTPIQEISHWGLPSCVSDFVHYGTKENYIKKEKERILDPEENVLYPFNSCFMNGE